MPPAPLDLLKTYLHQQGAHGVTHVPLSEAARAALADLTQPRRPKTAPAAVPATVRQPAAKPPAAPEAEMVARREQVSPAPPAPEPMAADPRSRADLLADLAQQARESQSVRDLGTLRDIMVFATGNPESDIVFIGEAPGDEEEKLGEPFVGPAGQLLTKIIQAMGLARSAVYITNICKYRPKIEDDRPQGSRNRPPTAAEMAACRPFVTAELEIIRPKVIVALGGTASIGLGIEGSVGRLRGKFHDYLGTPTMVTYHPSFLLRKEQEDGGGNAEKRMVWEDMMKAMKLMGLRITDKQRAYFSKVRG